MSSDPATDLDRLLAARMHGKPLPKDADQELLELVDLAESVITSLEEVPPPPGGLTAGRQALVEGAARARATQRPRPVPRPAWRRVFAWGVIATLLFVVLTLGSNVSASNSLPGDALYPVKRVGERVLLLMDNSPTVREELDSRRQREALELLRLGRHARVRFSGALLETHPNYWVIAGRETDFTVLLDEGTDIIGRPEIGNRVRVEAETRRGDLIALVLQVEPRPRAPGPGPASPTPSPPATDPAASPVLPGTAPGQTIPATPTATATPTPTATVAPPRPVPPEDDPEPPRSNSRSATATPVPSTTPTTGVKKVPPTVPASRTPLPSATMAASATPSPTATSPQPSVTPSPTDTPAPTAEPDTPTATVEPTATPRNETVPRATPSPTPAAHTP